MSWRGARWVLWLLVPGCTGDLESTSAPEVPSAPTSPASAFASPWADAAAPTHRFSIRFDYRFDALGFFDAERRALLEHAAGVWEERLLDDFEEIPVGTPLAVKDPFAIESETHELEVDEAIDDVLVFVACTKDLNDTLESARTRTATWLTSRWGPEFRADLEARWSGPDYEPWTSAIAFSCAAPFFWDPTPETDQDIPNDEQDFLSVAMHELGHVLGVATCEAYRSFISADGEVFNGPRSVELFGGPVPLERDAHVASEVVYEHQRVLMDATLSTRTRVMPTQLDLALLEDIGYQIAPEFR